MAPPSRIQTSVSSLHEDSQPADFNDFLAKLIADAKAYHTGLPTPSQPPFVMPTVVSAIDATRLANIHHVDYDTQRSARTTELQLIKAKKGGSQCWLSFCNVPTLNWIFDRATKTKPTIEEYFLAWHSFGLAVIQAPANATGKVVVIYDCDAPAVLDQKRRDEKTPANTSLKGLVMATVCSFPSTYRREKDNRSSAIHAVFYGDDGEGRPGSDECTQRTALWLRKMAALRDERWAGPEDDRTRRFTRIPTIW